MMGSAMLLARGTLAMRSMHVLAVSSLALLPTSCGKKEDPAKEEAEALQRHKAETAARRTKQEGRDPESIAQREAAAARASAEANSFEAKLHANNREACRRIAEDTRECRARRTGKACEQVGVDDMQACQTYMKRQGLDRNPF